VTSPEDPLRADLEWPDPSKPNRGYSYPTPASPGYGPPPASVGYGAPYGPPIAAAPARSRGPLWLFVIVAILIIAGGVAAWAIWF
jgi:hypothetical protein